MNKQRGITLIALVVTIIVLIILAGISINLALGENGIIQKSKIEKELSEEQTAKEKLKIEIASLSITKETGKDYSNEIFDNYLNNRGFIVNGDIVISNGWKFKVDKSVPEIVESLGKGTEIEQIEITTNVEYASNYTKANLKVVIVYEGEIVQIKIDGQEVEVPSKENGKYEISKEILKNGKYNIYIKDDKDSYKLVNIISTQISENITISTAEELVTFRDRVNKGATYEGKTITILQNIDLSSICSENLNISWIPIGTEETPFRGTFDGKGNTISNLYINNSTDTRQALFGLNDGIIQNLKMQNGYVKSLKLTTAMVVGRNEGSIINVENLSGIVIGAENIGGITSVNLGEIYGCTNNAIITYDSSGNNYGYRTAGIVGSQLEGKIERCINKANVTGTYMTGGIVGIVNTGTINECINIGNIVGNKDVKKSGGTAGGIAGISGWANTAIIKNCYNIGNVEAKRIAGGIVGTTGGENGNCIIENSYNIGFISAKSTTYSTYKGGILAHVDKNVYPTCEYTLNNNYWLSTCNAAYGIGIYSNNVGATKKTSTELKALSSTLGTIYREDNNNINNGYPILKWQIL